MGPHLLQQVPPLLGGKRLDQVLLGCGQNALKTHDEEIAEQVGANILGSPAHVILLETADSFTNGGFDLSVGFHGNFRRVLMEIDYSQWMGCQSRYGANLTAANRVNRRKCRNFWHLRRKFDA